MTTLKFMQITNEDLQGYLNMTINLLAHEMVNDGLIANEEQITDRYLALVVQKGKFAKMFDDWFGKDEKAGVARLAVVRIDHVNAKKEEAKQ